MTFGNHGLGRRGGHIVLYYCRETGGLVTKSTIMAVYVVAVTVEMP